MKTNKIIPIVFIIMLAVIIISGCADKEKTAKELLDNSKMEDEIYSAILEHNAHLLKFMDKIMEDKNFQTLMTQKDIRVKMINMSEKIDSLTSNNNQLIEGMTDRLIKNMVADSAVCDITCTKIMGNEYLNKYFMSHSKNKSQKK